MPVWLLDNFLVIVPLLSLMGGSLLFEDEDTQDSLRTRARWLVRALAVFTLAGVAFRFLFPIHSNSSWLAQTPVNFIFLSLVQFIAVILIKFSRNYMAGDQRLARYYRWFFFVIGSVSLTVISNHLMMFWCGWVWISLALHKLITYYPNRPRAMLAAHKKFFLARTAETLLFVAFVLLYQKHGTFIISELSQHYLKGAAELVELSYSEHIAAVLIATAALIKCAQFPVHGWLIQVVESPTPVSALLHAGVINLGGFLLIHFAPLFMQSFVAQWLVLIVAGTGAVLSSLIMTTRVSVKVRLAWSTCAQMGFLLVECALGLFELALLHLCAHSLYKVYSFLNSGNAVNEELGQKLGFGRSHNTALEWFFALFGAALLTILSYHAVDYAGPWSPWLLAAFGLTLLLLERPTASMNLRTFSLPVTGLLLLSVYILQKIGLGYGVGSLQILRQKALSLPDLWIMALFTGLFLTYLFITYRPGSSQARKLTIRLYAGFYLDEWFTRITLSLWPIALNTRGKRESFRFVRQSETIKGPLTDERYKFETL